MSSMRRYGIVMALLALPVLAHSPASVQQLQAQARSALAARNLPEALADYQKLVQIVPRSAAYQDELGFLLAASKRTSESIEHFRRATELDPKMAQAWFHLGAALMLSGEQNAGIQALEKAAALAPDRADYRYRLGAAYNDAHQYA
ncbi:MAG: tetratricopeptide repeat protein, partial [Bryobacteraceae bacterium]